MDGSAEDPAGSGDAIEAPDSIASVAHGGVREMGDPGAPAEQWEAFGVRPETVGAWRALGFGPFEAALAQGDGYGPQSARHAAARLRRLARSWRHVGLASAEGLRWHRAGFEAREAARWQDQGVDLEEVERRGGGHRLLG
ncbi:MAG: hypothetical protein ACRDY3_04375 [Acidimicrobiales bacterium]